MTTYTTSEVAAALGVTPRRVRALATRTGVGTRHGRDWLFTAADLAALQSRNTAAGRPRATIKESTQ